MTAPRRLIDALRERTRDPLHAIDQAYKPTLPVRAAHPEELTAAERALGFPLDAGLRQIYLEVGNGGFGPGYGLMGFGGGYRSDEKLTADEDYLRRIAYDTSEGWFWPSKVVPICHWGCAIYSCIDLREPGARVVRFDPNPISDDWERAWGSEGHTFTSWLEAWLAGDELFETGTPVLPYLASVSKVPDTWWLLSAGRDNEAKVQAGLETELRRELAPDHALAGETVRALAKCNGCDRALFHIGQSRRSMVHLTWSGKRETAPYPEFEDFFVDTREGAVAYPEHDH